MDTEHTPQGLVEEGLRHLHGEGRPWNPEKAVECFRKAAEMGDSAGQYHLGLCYILGAGVHENPDEADRWLVASAKQGNPDAIRTLHQRYGCDVSDPFLKEGELAWYAPGEMPGGPVPEDPEQAAQWYLAAAERGLAQAQNNLANCYLDGIGIQVDFHEARRWYEAAAGQGDVFALFNLGLFYADCYCSAGPDEAVKCFLKAAEQGYARAMFQLGVHYRNGYGVPKDAMQAFDWFMQASENGCKTADVCLMALDLS